MHTTHTHTTTTTQTRAATAQDGVQQPYEDLLPYHEFSVRIPRARISQLVDALRAVTPARHERMRASLAAHAPAFVWDEARGGRAYGLLVESLRRRATALMGGQL
jgi:hypothetical protein